MALLTLCPKALEQLKADGADGSAAFLALLDLTIVDVLTYDDCADRHAALVAAFVVYRDAVSQRETRRAQPAKPVKKWWWER